MGVEAENGAAPGRQPSFKSLLSFEFGDLSLDDREADGEEQQEQRQQERRQQQQERSAEHGYDVLVRLIRAINLPAADWWNGRADPYIVARCVAPDGASIEYRSQHVPRELNPVFDEFFEVGNVPAAGCRLDIEVWDKDVLTRDDVLGKVSWQFCPQQAQQAQQQPAASRQSSGAAEQQQPPAPSTFSPLQAAFLEQQQRAAQQAAQQAAQDVQQPPLATSGRASLRLELWRPHKRGTQAPSELEMEVQWQPSEGPGVMRLLGPVRFRQQLSPGFGMLMQQWNDDRSMAFSTFKVFLCHIDQFFGDVTCPWNREYANAQKVFTNPVLRSSVRSQHAMLYATQLGRSRFGVLRDAADFFVLFNGGQRNGQRRYFTYSLLPDSLRCSETGARFMADMMSKHAMHAGGAEDVLFAGEFCIVPEPGAAGGFRLIIDNNSGTYAPNAKYLPRLRDLLLANFPDIAVETVAADDPRLAMYHQQCPSRVKAAAAAAAAAAQESVTALGSAASG